MNQPWLQNFDPLGNPILSTLAAAVPVCTLFYFLAVRRTPAWRAAIYAFAAALIVALAVFRMPAVMVAGAVADGMVFGIFRIAWVVVAAVFVYDISVESGQFEIIKRSVGEISSDRRLQVLLIAFAFGALLEGAGGGGAPVAVTGAMMIGLGFPPFQTAMMCLIANSAPVAWGGMGNPVRTLVAVTGLPEADFSAMLGRILPIIVVILPFWLIRVLCKTRDTLAVWPGLLVCGLTFGGIQFFWSNFMDSALVDILGGIGTLLVLAFFFRKVWSPRKDLALRGRSGRAQKEPGRPAHPPANPQSLVALPAALRLRRALGIRARRQGAGIVLLEAAGPRPAPSGDPHAARRPQIVRGAGILRRLLALHARHRHLHRRPDRRTAARPVVQTRRSEFSSAPFRNLRLSLIAIMAMLGLGYLTRYCGMDATMGMALAHTGAAFPFFGTMIGWLGVALSGTDAGSNALFGSLQTITANKLGLSPILMGAANSAGGVMGKMIAAQSLVIGCAVTGQQGQEGALFRAVMKHSIGLLILVGLLVLMYAYVFPGAIPNGHHFW